MNATLATQIDLLNPSEREHMPLLPELGGYGVLAINMALLTELYPHHASLRKQHEGQFHSDN